ncbi:AMIN domain-containing protein [Desulfobulbus alkaliphilus]|uniref:AMIN domain-containing protein n=1 Tax=Desulfobulbus alkaliphilus TaxID=869814 RepID=UPI001965D0B6|nr:AMIN domain-containing protein [Desulfobulbus alkaliphilus]MBM9536602.1 AMIN domain-containing protein [Desulfobulbus alkaliphilus]
MARFSPGFYTQGLGTTLCVLLLTLCVSSPSVAQDAATEIESITWRMIESQTEIRIKGSRPLLFTAYELPSPPRIIIDIAEARPAANLTAELPAHEAFTLSVAEVADAQPPITRLTFSLTESTPFTSMLADNEILLSFAVPGSPGVPTAGENPVSQLTALQVVPQPGTTVVRFLTSDPITDYSHGVLEGEGSAPPRLYIDLNAITMDASLPREQAVGTALARIRLAPRGSGVRAVLDSGLDTLFPYTIHTAETGLEVRINETARQDQVSRLINQNLDVEEHLPSIDPLATRLSPQAQQQQMEDAFLFSGYTRERISVEFQKMDLHNVFNFLRHVSGVNIVVDESVRGSLTLVLDEVPWDFALDIILNLKGLEKEERFNTLVIYPKGREFVWPQQAEARLSFQTDLEVVEQEALLIRQIEDQPPGVMEAKQIMARARDFEQRGDIETAVQLYEEALAKWSDNSQIANKIASLYLVQLRQNARALYFARVALDLDATNSMAALNAAIAAANMQDNQLARQYFEQSLNIDKPSKEALLSFAAFSEHQQRYADALRVLDMHRSLYGDDLNSMIATARVYDKMGNQEKATATYQAILLSGFRISPDLAQYINARVTISQPMY